MPGHTMVPGSIIGYLYQAVPHLPQASMSASLHGAHVLLAMLSGAGVSECLRSHQECSAPFVHYHLLHRSLGMEDAYPHPMSSDW